jgi:hypothetical protein
MSKLFKQQTLRYLLTLMDDCLRVNLFKIPKTKNKFFFLLLNRKIKVGLKYLIHMLK